MEPIIITNRVEPKIITAQGGTQHNHHRVEPNIITNRVEPNIITTRATRLASREEEAALRKKGGRGSPCGVVRAQGSSLLSSVLPTIISFPSYQRRLLPPGLVFSACLREHPRAAGWGCGWS